MLVLVQLLKSLLFSKIAFQYLFFDIANLDFDFSFELPKKAMWFLESKKKIHIQFIFTHFHSSSLISIHLNTEKNICPCSFIFLLKFMKHSNIKKCWKIIQKFITFILKQFIQNSKEIEMKSFKTIRKFFSWKVNHSYFRFHFSFIFQLLSEPQVVLLSFKKSNSFGTIF